MALPLQVNGSVGQAIVGSHVYLNTDLGIARTLGASASGIANASFNTGIPATVLVFGKAGSGSFNVALNATSSSALNFAGATWQNFASAGNGNYVTINTTFANPYVSLALVDTGASSSNAAGSTTGASLVTVYVTYETTAGENWNSVNSGSMACASRVRGDGSGVNNPLSLA